MKWRQFFAAGQRRLPRTATFAERGQLTKQLAAEWRAGHRHESPSRRNPSGGGSLVKLGLIVGGALVAVRVLKRPGTPSDGPGRPADMNWDPVRNCYSGLAGQCLPGGATRRR